MRSTGRRREEAEGTRSKKYSWHDALDICCICQDRQRARRVPQVGRTTNRYTATQIHRLTVSPQHRACLPLLSSWIPGLPHPPTLLLPPLLSQAYRPHLLVSPCLWTCDHCPALYLRGGTAPLAVLGDCFGYAYTAIAVVQMRAMMSRVLPVKPA